MPAFRTHDGQHFLRLYHPDKPRGDGREGQVWANAEGVGPDETFELVPADGGRVGLRCHGVFLSAQPDGRLETRTWLRSWEQWTIVSAGAVVGLRSHHGMFLCAEQGGGGEVVANRKAMGPWESFASSHGVTLPVPVGPLTRLRVEGNSRYFASDAGRFDWREITAFALLAYYQHGRADEAREWMRAAVALGFTQGRVLCTYTIGRDVIGPAGPDRPGYWDALDALCRDAAAAGFRLRLTIFGALEPFGAVWVHSRPLYTGDVQRRGDAFALELARRVKDFEHVCLELANEPANIGFRGLEGALTGLGAAIKGRYPQIVLVMGDVNGMEFSSAFASCFDAVDSHVDRNPEMRFMHAHKRLGEMPFRDQQIRPMPALSGEPYNAGAERRDGTRGGSQGACPYPVSAFAHAAVCRARQILPTFHCDDGLYCTPLAPETVACAKAFHAALDAFPMLDDRRWRGQHGLGAGDYWRDVWPDTDDIREVERHVRDGRGPWRANGIGPFSVVFPEPLGWDYRRNLDAPAERIAYLADDAWGVGIYRRQ